MGDKIGGERKEEQTRLPSKKGSNQTNNDPTLAESHFNSYREYVCT
jgi:hypothetical protein